MHAEHVFDQIGRYLVSVVWYSIEVVSIRGLQAGLQRQDLGRDLVLVDALDLVEHGLRHSLELGLAVGRGLDGVLRAGELRLHVLNRLLAGLRRQVCRNPLLQRVHLRL